MTSTSEASRSPVPVTDGPHRWHRLLAEGELAPGRLTTVSSWTAHALSHHNGPALVHVVTDSHLL